MKSFGEGYQESPAPVGQTLEYIRVNETNPVMRIKGAFDSAPDGRWVQDDNPTDDYSRGKPSKLLTGRG